MSRRISISSAALLTAVLVAYGLGASPGDSVDDDSGRDPSWRLDSLWDDGQAELCDYEVVWARYGRHYPGRARLILVKEPWAPDLEVKADHPRPDGFEVLKLNHLRDVATGVYTYRQMASVFVRRDSGAVRKIATSSAEECGISTAHMVGGELEIRSYFDGVGERTLTWPREALPEDGLPALLRDFVAASEPPTRLLVVPALMDNRLAAVEPREYTLVRRPAPVELTGGERVEAVELALEGAEPSLSFQFERASPHRLLALSTAMGTRYQLRSCRRVAYWKLNAPGDAFENEG